jgi:adenylyltransferase/sulfurtransferase
MTASAIQAEELKERLDAGENLLLLDVREEDEYEISNIGGQLIPLAELPERTQELDASREIIALCNVRSLTGGIHAWSDRVDPRVRKY